jgi:hypothetical protein
MEMMRPSPKLLLGTTASENGAGEAPPQRVPKAARSTSHTSADLVIVEIYRNPCPDHDQHKLTKTGVGVEKVTEIGR